MPENQRDKSVQRYLQILQYAVYLLFGNSGFIRVCLVNLENECITLNCIKHEFKTMNYLQL